MWKNKKTNNVNKRIQCIFWIKKKINTQNAISLPYANKLNFKKISWVSVLATDD